MLLFFLVIFACLIYRKIMKLMKLMKLIKFCFLFVAIIFF